MKAGLWKRVKFELLLLAGMFVGGSVIGIAGYVGEGNFVLILGYPISVIVRLTVWGIIKYTRGSS